MAACTTNLNKFPVYAHPKYPFEQPVEDLNFTWCLSSADSRKFKIYIIRMEGLVEKYESAAEEFNE